MHVPALLDRPAAPGLADSKVASGPRFVFRAMRRGVAFAALRSRAVRLDADAYLVLDADEPCAIRRDPDPATEMTTVAVCNADCVAAQALGPLASCEPLLGDSLIRPGHLFPSDSAAGRRLLRIAEWRASGRPPAEEREDRIALVGEAANEYAALLRRAGQMDCVKCTTRESLLQRILIASDFIASHFDEPISLDEMARAASLSRFHFVRLFRLVHAETPHAFLLRKRTAVARRRLAEGDGPGEAASRAGFGSRSTMFRNLRKTSGNARADSSCSLFA